MSAFEWNAFAENDIQKIVFSRTLKTVGMRAFTNGNVVPSDVPVA